MIEWVTFIVLGTAAVALIAALLYRLSTLRRAGAPAIMRALPNADGHGWRHGVMRLGERSLAFSTLSSLRFGPSYRLDRARIDVVGRRSPFGSEYDIMRDDTRVVTLVEVADQSTEPDRSWELAVDVGGLTALLAWLESRPDRRSQRPGPATGLAS